MAGPTIKHIVIDSITPSLWTSLCSVLSEAGQLEVPTEYPGTRLVIGRPGVAAGTCSLAAESEAYASMVHRPAYDILKMFGIESPRFELLAEGEKFRLKALRSFGTVSAGDLGGLVWGPPALSQQGTSWVEEGGIVADGARLQDSAVVTSKGAASGKKILLAGNSRVLSGVCDRSLTGDDTFPYVEPSARGEGDGPVDRGGNKAISSFLEASPQERLELVRVGFELETQGSDGWGRDGARLDAPKGVSELYLSQHIAKLVKQTKVLPRDADLPGDGTWDMATRLTAWHRLRLTKKEREQFTQTLPIEEVFGDLPEDLIERSTDGTVRGFEWRTKGPLTVDQFRQAATWAFSHKHEIDTGCSFHVHVSVPGVKHSHGASMMRLLTEYILSNMEQVPEGVQKRFKAGLQWYNPAPTKNPGSKHTFVNCHEQGSWEFRCFGNVSDLDSAMRCLDLAVEALAYAYGVKFGGKKSWWIKLTDSEWLDRATKSMKSAKVME